MTDDTTPMKTCTKCDETFLATAEYFYRKKDNKDGLESRCKTCQAERKRQYYRVNREAIAEQHRQYYRANREAIVEHQRQFYEANQEQIAERHRQYQQVNREQVAEYQRQWYITNRKQIAERHCQYREANREKEAERSRRYHEANPEKARINDSRRRARKQGLPDTFTGEQWIQCLEYFNYTCPVCDNQLRDLFGNVEPHADHWIPLSADACPGTIASNMICLCNKCNLAKHDKLPDVWLKQKFGARKAKQIITRIEAYFEWATQ